MSITSDQLKILVALRDAAALRREPGPITPDGHEKWFRLSELVQEGRLPHDDDGFASPALCAAARSLRKQGLVAGRVQHTVTWYSLTGAGGSMLARLEAEAGVTDLAAAERALEQAEKDEQAAIDRCHAARAALYDARAAYGRRPALRALYLLLDALEAVAR
jgi:hypothetical protein